MAFINTNLKSTPIEIHGIGVSPGVAIGKVFLLQSESLEESEREVSEEEIPGEMLRFQNALMATRQQISDLQVRMAEEIGIENAGIFDAHILMAEDHSFIDKILKGLHARKRNVETIVRDVVVEYVEAFARIDDAYIRERATDLRDVTDRILSNLEKPEQSDQVQIEKGSIIIARDLSPSETVLMDRDLVAAFATDAGSLTSHTALTARSLEIPAVVGLVNIVSRVNHGDSILIDGTRGCVIIHPTPGQKAQYGHLSEVHAEIKERLKALKDSPASTADGKTVHLSANIESCENVSAVLKHGADGVGLFRSEYLFLTRTSLPTEDEQAADYAETAKALNPAPVIIRTLDVGGDKIASHLNLPDEKNPFLGCRGIRLCLSHPDLFLTQLRAILRASAVGNVKIMFPMISNAEEVSEAIELLDMAKKQLSDKGLPFNPEIEIGVMIEVPAAALAADLIAPLVNFFSIGTNDLIQYTFAVDRLNERVANLYRPTHPAILQLIAKTVEAGHAGGCWVGLCGEMASQPVLAPLLVGLGIDELSASPPAVPLVKCALRGVRFDECTELAKSALQATSADSALEMCRDLVSKTAPEIIELLG